MPASRQIILNQRRIFILPTGLGAGYILTAFLLFIAGVNYDNSLILSLSFLLASLFIVTILQTFSNLSRMMITAGKSEPAFAGTESQFEITLSKSQNKNHCSIQCLWQGYNSTPIDLKKQTQVLVKMLLPTQKRGLFQPGRMKFFSDYPLGLCRAWTWVDLDMSSWTYPKPIATEVTLKTLNLAQEGSVISPDGNDDFEGLRTYQNSDSLRTVDWKAYARRGSMLTKTFHGYQSRSLWIEWDSLPNQNIEMKLSQMCFLVLEYSKINLEYGLKLPNLVINPGTGKNHEKSCLEALARY